MPCQAESAPVRKAQRLCRMPVAASAKAKRRALAADHTRIRTSLAGSAHAHQIEGTRRPAPDTRRCRLAQVAPEARRSAGNKISWKAPRVAEPLEPQVRDLRRARASGRDALRRFDGARRARRRRTRLSEAGRPRVASVHVRPEPGAPREESRARACACERRSDRPQRS
jgi:hypothetical protein